MLDRYAGSHLIPATKKQPDRRNHATLDRVGCSIPVIFALFGCGGAPATPTDQTAPVAYADILARFQQIRTDYGTMDQRLQSYKTYADSLVGNHAIDWSAWVMDFGKGGDQNYLSLLLLDPSGQDSESVVYTGSDATNSLREPETTTFNNLSDSQIAGLKIGQQVTFSGVISAAYQQLSFNNVDFTAIAPTPTPAQSPQPLPSDLEIGMQEVRAEFLPQETITINAAGHVHVDYTYLYQEPMQTAPAPIDKTVLVDQVAALVALFNQSNYNLLHSYLLESDCTGASTTGHPTPATSVLTLNIWIKQNGDRSDVYTNRAVLASHPNST